MKRPNTHVNLISSGPTSSSSARSRSGETRELQRDVRYVRAVAKRFEKAQKKRNVVDSTGLESVRVVESFLRRKKRLCYGGTAVNNILPTSSQFYDRARELPDYDFYSPNALEDAKELADTFYRRGFQEVEAKAGFHKGTYKVFVNFVAIADITHMDLSLYRRLKRDSILRAGISYVPVDFLRMAMYLELSRPMGDVSRWEKVYRRLRLLNRHFPLFRNACRTRLAAHSNRSSLPSWWVDIETALAKEKVVFFGSTAWTRIAPSIPHPYTMDVLSTNAKTVAEKVARTLPQGKGYVRTLPPVGDHVPERFEVRCENRVCATVYQTQACYAYVETIRRGQRVRLANVETMMSLYLALQYVPGCGHACGQRIACLCETLFRLRQRNEIRARGLLQTFPPRCYGEQPTVQSLRKEKTERFRTLKKRPRSKEYETWFLRYVPLELQ